MLKLVRWAVQKLWPAREKGTVLQANDQLPARTPGQLSVLPQASSCHGSNPLRSVSFGSEVQVQEIASGEEWNSPELLAVEASNPSSDLISVPASRSSGSSRSHATRRKNAHVQRICLDEAFDVNALWSEASGQREGEREIRLQDRSRESGALLPHSVPDSEPPGIQENFREELGGEAGAGAAVMRW